MAAGKIVLLEWLRLLRLPNLCTALADVAMGYTFIPGSPTGWQGWILLSASSSGLYLAGMVWNDIFDLEQDRRERPWRPLPSGSVRVRSACVLGAALLAIGVLAGWSAAWVAWRTGLFAPWRAGVLALLIALAVVLYDARAKRSWYGPAVMGSCRAGNVLLGASLSDLPTAGQMIWEPSLVCVATGIGVYVTGITQFARSEAGSSKRSSLYLGSSIMFAGFVVVGMFPWFGSFATEARELTFGERLVWPLLVSLIAYPVLRRGVNACRSLSRTKVQSTVGSALRTLIILDAAVCLAVVQPPYVAVAVLALLLPMLWGQRWIALT